jgi:hypothetical protein
MAVISIESDSTVAQAAPAMSHTSDAPPRSAVAEYSILGRQRTGADAIRSFRPGPLPADVSESRRTPTNAGNFAFWIVPGRAGACLVAFSKSAGGGAGCYRYDQMQKEGGSVLTIGPSVHSTLAKDDIAVFGFVPDGVSKVDLRLADGHHRMVPVKENAFAVIVSGTPTSARYRNDSGSQTSLGIASCGPNC